MENSQKIEEAEKLRERFRAKTFRMMLHIALIFGIPAALAAVVGTKIDAAQATGRTWTLILLGVSFVVSWVLMIRMYIRLNKEAKEVDRAVREAKKKQ